MDFLCDSCFNLKQNLNLNLKSLIDFDRLKSVIVLIKKSIVVDFIFTFRNC